LILTKKLSQLKEWSLLTTNRKPCLG